MRFLLNRTLTPVLRRNASQAGFSFVELLFAVMILGIGLIMIAAIFPAGLSQTKASFDETQTASIARAALNQVASGATKSAFNLTDGIVHPLQVLGDNTAPTTLLAQGNMIVPSDPRYAWVGMYLRGKDAATGQPNSYAQFCAILVQNSDTFKPTVAFPFFSSSSVRSLEARPVAVDIINGVATLGAVSGATNGNQYNAGAAGEGAYIVIAIDNEGANTDISNSTDRAAAAGQLNGRVYRLGSSLGGTQYSLYPGQEFTPVSFSYVNSGTTYNATIPSIRGATAFIVGRNRLSATDFDGPVMDVAYYTSFVGLK